MAEPPEGFPTSTDTTRYYGGFSSELPQYLRVSLLELLYPVVSPYPKDRPPPEPPIVLEDAEIRWGKPSNFSHGTRKGPHYKYTVNWDQGDGDDDDEEEPDTPVLERNEVEGTRVVSTIRVTSQDDPDVWVDVERIDEITFTGPMSLTDGTMVNFHYKLTHPPASGT